MTSEILTADGKSALERVVERWVGRVLRLGVSISASLMIAGLLLAWFSTGSVQPPRENPSPGEVLRALGGGACDPGTLIFAGLLLLMLTPFIRVLTAAIGFAAEKDKPFVVVALVVLAMLIGELVFSLR